MILSDMERKPAFYGKESCYSYRRQRTQRCSPFKRRKLFKRSLISTSGRGVSGEGDNSPEKNSNGEVVGLGATLHGGQILSLPLPLSLSQYMFILQNPFNYIVQ